MTLEGRKQQDWALLGGRIGLGHVVFLIPSRLPCKEGDWLILHCDFDNESIFSITNICLINIPTCLRL